MPSNLNGVGPMAAWLKVARAENGVHLGPQLLYKPCHIVWPGLETRSKNGSGSKAKTSPLDIMASVRSRLRAVDPHSFYADPDPEVFLNADPFADPDLDQGPGPA